MQKTDNIILDTFGPLVFFCVHPINQKIQRLFRAPSNEYATPFCVLMINNNKKLEDDLVYFPTKFGYNYQV